MRRHIKTFLGYLLTITILISDIPIITQAALKDLTESSSTVSENTVSVTENTTTSEEPHVLYELIEKRNETTKYFAMSDGTTKAYIYPQNIHYLKDGNYEEIDNTLTKTAEAGNHYYKNKNNSFSVKIPESFADDYIEFSDENGYVKFKLLGSTNKKMNKIIKNKTSKDEDITIAKNVNDKAIFKSVKGDIDVEYDLAGNKLKETIVLYKKTKNSFIFDIQTSASKAVKNSNNSISFFDAKGAELYTIESPYMLDAAGEYSSAVETTLIASTNGYTLTYQPDYKWLSAKERVYPVKIDPTLIQAIDRATVTDTYVTNLQTATDNDVRGAWDVLNIGRRTQAPDGYQIVLRGFIKFDLPSQIGANDTIIDAKLDLVHYTGGGTSNNGAQIDVHELTAAFSAATTWWGTQPSYDPIITDYVLVNTNNTFSGSTLSYDSYNITRLVNKWHNGSTNHGIMLKLHNDTTNVSTNQQVFYFANQSTYYGNVSKFVEITYRNTTGLEDYWSYTTQDLGQYGMGYVNNYNGNLVYVHNDATYHSDINGFQLSHIYNTNLSAESSFYGKGWRLNLVQKFESVTVSGNSSVKFKYTDGDGTEHYFVETTDGKIVDEDGLGYTYSSINETLENGATVLKHQIKGKDGTILKFDNNSYLRRIIDSNENTICLNYTTETNSYRLTSVTTSSGGNISLIYDNGKLSYINDNSGRKTYFRYDSEKLSEIQYPDTSVLRFEYNGSGYWLSSIVSPDNQKIAYQYLTSSRRVSAIKYYGTTGILSTNTTITYSHNQTEITDTKGRNLVYQFDTFGRVTCIYDDHQNIYSQTYNETIYNGSDIFHNNKIAGKSQTTAYVNNLLANPAFNHNLNNWSFYKQNADAQASVITTDGLLSSKTVKITSGGNSIEVIWQDRPLTTEARTYTLSGYLKLVNVESERNHGAGLEIVTGGSQTRYLYNFTPGTTDTEIDNGFQHMSLTVTLAEGEYIDRVTAGLYNASGTVYIDSLQLEEGEVANVINLVENSSFEKTAGENCTPSGFTDSYDDALSGTTTLQKHTGNHSYKVNGSVGENRFLLQQMNFSGKAGDVYSFGGWVKGNPAPKKDNTKFNMLFRFIYTDGTEQWFAKWFNNYVSDWQAVKETVVAQKDYSSMDIYCCYLNVNTAYFDNFFLYRDTMQSYRYDKNGNVISTSDYASQNGTFGYDGSHNLTRLIEPTGSAYEYFYNSKNNPISARSDEEIAYDIIYDQYGNATSTNITNHRYADSIRSEQVYYIRLKSSGKYLAVEGSGTENNTNVIQETFTGGDNQKWILKQTTDGYYCLRPIYLQNRSLDVSNGALGDGNIAVHTNNLSEAQKFHITPQSDFTYQLTAKCFSDERAVSVCNANTQNNVTIVMIDNSNAGEQRWYFEEVNESPVTFVEDGEVYQFRSRHSGKYMDLRNNNSALGSFIQQYESNYSVAQKFVLSQYDDTEYFTIALKDKERLVEVSTENHTSGYPYLMIGDLTVTDRKLFKFVYNETHQGFQIIPKCDQTKSVSISNLSYANEAILVVTPITSEANRIFFAEKFSDAITSSATYQDNGNFPHTITDARGNTTTYTYDVSRGLQTGVTDAKGNTIEYTYNSLNDRLERVQASGSSVSYQYEINGALKNITTPSGSVYNFTYDIFGRPIEILIGTRSLSKTTYQGNDSSLVSRVDYGNGVYKSYTYDNQDRLISESVNNVISRDYVYDKRDNIVQTTDYLGNVTTRFNYDFIGRISNIKASDGQSMNFVYDNFNRLSLSKWSLGSTSLTSGYIYGDYSVEGQKTGLIYGVNLNSTQRLGYQYDELARLKNRTINTTTPYVTEYGYLEGGATNTTTTLVKTIKNGNNTLEYSYDELGNITAVAKNGTVIETYIYDSLGQLTGATYGGNTYTYSYDNGGNITEIKKNNVVIKSYTYGDSEWKDLLTAFNGEIITYDGIGNPLTYRNGLSFTWQNGRQLANVSQNGNAIATYTYDADGHRTSKTVNGTSTEYYWLNGTLYGQKTGEEYVFFLYDENGSPYGMILKNNAGESYYYYEFNLQGDIIGIIDNAGTKVVEYTYGAWGDILSVTGTLADTIGQKNPLRYRGYYYDAETGVYYGSSRYYDPEIGRWINSDNMVLVGDDILGTNLFAYCGNNPINRVDPSGHAWLSAIIKTVAKIAVAALAIAKIVCTVKEVKRVKNELDTLPEPTKDITDSFRDTLRKNADTVKETTKNKGIIESGKQFYNNVRNKGEWDLKQNPEYQGTFQFNDLVIQGQDIGNINFGYTGKALGLPDSVLLMGAGVAQIMAGTSNFSFIMASNGDDLRDQMYIMYGIMLYQEDN